MSDDRHRNVCFTINNHTPETLLQFEKLPKHNYLVYGYETGASGTPHIQGYVEFKNPVSWKRIKKALPTAHLEDRRGTSQQAADYCKKDADYIEIGEISKPGKRNDLDAVREILQTGGERAVVEQATSCNAVRFAQMYLKVKEKARRFKPTVIWLYGQPGVGKTLAAMYDAHRRGYGNDLHLQSGQGKWWEGYDAHKAVIIDDIRSDFYPFSRMLNLLDRYECRVENKGGSRQFLARVIYITSPEPPQCVWETKENMDQLLRRIDTIQEIISLSQSNIDKGNAIRQNKPEDYPEDDKEFVESVESS